MDSEVLEVKELAAGGSQVECVLKGDLCGFHWKLVTAEAA